MPDSSNGSLKILYNENDEKPKSGIGHCDIVDATMINTNGVYLNTDTFIGIVPSNLGLDGSYTPLYGSGDGMKDIKIESNIDNYNSVSDEELKAIVNINKLEDLALPLDKIQQMAKELLKLRSLWYRQ